MQLKTKTKMLKFLIDIKQLSEKGSKFSMQELCYVHGIGKQVPSVLAKNNIINKNEFGFYQLSYNGQIDMQFVDKIARMLELYYRNTKKRQSEIIKAKYNKPEEVDFALINEKLDKLLNALNIK